MQGAARCAIVVLPMALLLVLLLVPLPSNSGQFALSAATSLIA